MTHSSDILARVPIIFPWCRLDRVTWPSNLLSLTNRIIFILSTGIRVGGPVVTTFLTYHTHAGDFWDEDTEVLWLPPWMPSCVLPRWWRGRRRQPRWELPCLEPTRGGNEGVLQPTASKEPNPGNGHTREPASEPAPVVSRRLEPWPGFSLWPCVRLPAPSQAVPNSLATGNRDSNVCCLKPLR